MKEAAALFQRVLAAEDAKIAKVLGVGFAPSVCTLSARSRISDRLKE